MVKLASETQLSEILLFKLSCPPISSDTVMHFTKFLLLNNRFLTIFFIVIVNQLYEVTFNTRKIQTK